MPNRYTGFTPSLAALLLGLLLLYALTLPLLSGDLGWHIRVGQYVLDRGEVPRLNFLCYTASWHPWVAHEWLAGVLFAVIDAAGGLSALLLARGLLFFATLTVLHRLGRRLGAEPLSLALLLVFTAITLALHVSLRPWAISNLLLALQLLLVQRLLTEPERTHRLWFFPLLLGLWINLHGGFIVGVGLFVVTLVAWFRKASAAGLSSSRRWAGVLLPALAALVLMLLNPYGIDALMLPFLYLIGEQSTGLALTGEIKEWGPIALDSFFGGVYLLWWGLALVAVASSRTARQRPELLPGLLFLVMTFGTQRHLPLAALFLFPVVCSGLLEPLQRRLQRATGSRASFIRGLSALEAVPRTPFMALLVLAAVAFHLNAGRDPGFESDRLKPRAYPIDAVRALETLPGGRLFNHYDWAGFIAWRAPRWPLFITPVNDAYPRRLLEDWFTIANLKPGWEQKLDAYQVDTVFMPASSALVVTLQQRPGWSVYYDDGVATLVVRREAAPYSPPVP